MAKTTEKVYSEAEVQARLTELKLEGWTLENGWLRRKYTTDGWPITILLVNAIAFVCEAANHHADLEVTWGKLWVKLQSHSAGGITDKDFIVAQKIEEVALWQPTPEGPLESRSTKFVQGKK